MTLRHKVIGWLGCIALLTVLLPAAWAQNQAKGKAQPKPQLKPASVKAPSRAPAQDITSLLQSQAAAQAASQIPLALTPPSGPTPLTDVPVVSSSGTLAWPLQVPVAQPPVELVPPPPADHVQLQHLQHLQIAQQIHVGLLPCELGASVRIEADATRPGYFNVQAKGLRYRMFPVQTSTGALRLEDKKAGAVWLQLANKSMLMDQKRGRRLADECAHPEQLAVAEAMKTNPPPSLIDIQGMGR
jgi:hypothetical protein